MDGALLSTQAAVVARLGGLGHHAYPSCFFIGTVSGQRGLGVVSGLQLGPDVPAEVLQLLSVLAVGTSGGVLVGDGVLGNGGHSCHHLEACLNGGILQLHQGVFIGTVAVHAHQNCPGAVALHGGQTLDGGGGNPASIGGHGNDSHILPCAGVLREVGIGVGEVHRNGLGLPALHQQVSGLLGAARGTEGDFVKFHGSISFLSMLPRP